MRIKEYFLVFVLYLLLAVTYTFPLVIKMDSSTYGYSGDNLGSIHYFWWWKESFLNGRDVRDSFLEEAPFGVTIDREPGTVLFYLPVKVLTLLTGEVAAYNLVLLLSFPLSGLTMYLLAKFLLSGLAASRSDASAQSSNHSVFPIALLAGFIFAFSPYHLWKAYNHLDLALIWPLPLFLLSLFSLEAKSREGGIRPLLKPSFWLSLSWSITILTNFYYGYFLLLLFVLYVFFKLIFEAVFQRRFYLTRNLFLSFLLSTVMTVAIAAPTTIHVYLDAQKSSASSQSFLRRDSYQRPFLNLVSLSSRPWDYLLPSADHPVFGRLVTNIYQWITKAGNDFKTTSGPIHERTIYLGIINIILLPLSVFFLVFRRNFRAKLGPKVGPLLLISLFLIIISFPPYVFVKGQTLYLPSSFLYRFFPMFRTYSRLGIVVLMVATLVSAAVLFYSLRRLSRSIKLVVLWLIIFVSVFDFLNFPPFKSINLKTPDSYSWLAEQTGNFSVIEYPQDFNVAESLFFQRVHGKGVLNFHSTSPYFGLWPFLTDFQILRTTKILESLGVRFALFHKDLLFPEKNPVDDLWYRRAFLVTPNYKNLPGFKLVEDFPETAILEIEKTDNPVALILLTGTSEKVKLDQFPRQDWIWSGKEGSVYLVNLVPQTPVRVTVNLTNEKIDQSRIKTISFNGELAELPEGRITLVLEKTFNELLIVKNDTEPIDFGRLTVEGFGAAGGKTDPKVL